MNQWIEIAEQEFVPVYHRYRSYWNEEKVYFCMIYMGRSILILDLE